MSNLSLSVKKIVRKTCAKGPGQPHPFSFGWMTVYGLISLDFTVTADRAWVGYQVATRTPFPKSIGDQVVELSCHINKEPDPDINVTHGCQLIAPASMSVGQLLGATHQTLTHEFVVRVPSGMFRMVAGVDAIMMGRSVEELIQAFHDDPTLKLDPLQQYFPFGPVPPRVGAA